VRRSNTSRSVVGQLIAPRAYRQRRRVARLAAADATLASLA